MNDPQKRTSFTYFTSTMTSRSVDLLIDVEDHPVLEDRDTPMESERDGTVCMSLRRFQEERFQPKPKVSLQIRR